MKKLLNGIEVAYTDEGTGLPVVFIHGFPLARTAWARQIAEFRTSNRVIAVDLPGFGESGPPAGPMPMAGYADTIGHLLGHLGTGPVALAGHSMGGYIALAFANAHPEMLKGLALVSTRPGPDTPEGAQARRATAQKVGESGPGLVIDAMAPKMVSDPAMIPDVRTIMSSATRDGIIAALLGMADRPDCTDPLPKLKLPVWVVSGDHDALIPHAESERMAKLIPGATLSLIPGAGHLVALEKPVEFNSSLAEWLKTLDRGA